MEYYSVIKKNEILPFAATWMDLKSIMLSEISQRKKSTVCNHLCVESKKTNLELYLGTTHSQQVIEQQTKNRVEVMKRQN